jgi:hypothetical protein
MKASRADGERFRSIFLEEVRKGGREFRWAEETIVLEPYTVGHIHDHRWQKFLESQQRSSGSCMANNSVE